FGASPDGPVQVIAPAGEPALPLVDLAGLPEGRRTKAALALAQAEAARPFDLAAGPLLRCLLLRLSEERHVLVVNLHHIVTDGWSMGVLAREMEEAYRALKAGRRPSLPELPVQYADYALWQRRRLSGETLAGELAWWRERLAGAPALLELPLDRPRPGVQRFRGRRRPVHLPAPLAEAVRALGQKAGTTPFMTLLAAFQALLSRVTGQKDVPVGSPIAGRERAEVFGLIGFFVNT